MKVKKNYSQGDVEAIVNRVRDAAHEMIANATDNTFRNKISASLSGGYDFADTLHNIYSDFGYPAQLQFVNYWNMFRRFGVAGRVVEIYPQYGWSEPPMVEGSSSFNKEFDLLVKKVKLWNRVKGLDVRQRVGRYAGLFVRVRDGKNPKEPIDGMLSGVDSLVDLIPLYESQLRVTTVNDDVMSDDYGQPTMYQYQPNVEGGRDPNKSNGYDIHPSRLIMASEGADDGSIYGISSLERPYNSLMDLRKVIGGGAEGFYKNAAQRMVFKLTDQAAASANSELLKKFDDQFDKFIRDPGKKGFVSVGLDPKAVESHLASNPKEYFNGPLNDVAASTGIPATILIGQQTGRLASTEDSKMLLSNVNSRANDFQMELLGRVFDWMISKGILPASDYTIEFKDALAPSDADKLANVSVMADINKKQFETMQGPIYTPEEMREASGYEAEDFDDSGELLDDEED